MLEGGFISVIPFAVIDGFTWALIGGVKRQIGI